MTGSSWAPLGALGRAFGVFSGLTLLGLLISISTTPMFLFGLAPALLPAGTFSALFGDWSPGSLLVMLALSAALGSAICFLPAIALARFALRVWPADASGVPRRRCVVWQRLLSYAWVGVVLVAIVGNVVSGIGGEGPLGPHAAAGERARFMGLMGVVSGWGMLLGGSAALSSWLHAHPGRFLTGQFILYLRRFSGFADRTIISEVLKAAPAGVPVVFIASPQNQPRNWDPFVWAFSGLRLRHPVVSVPVQLRTPDEDWESVIARLIANAGIVVIDRTESSDSVAKEIRLVGQHASPERTIWLVDLSKARSNVGQSTASHHEPGQMVAYRHRWVFLSMTAKIGLFLFASGVMVSMLFPGLVRHEIDSTQVVTIAVVAGLWLICGAVVLIRPSIDREARQRLRESLALAVTAPSQPRDAWTAG